MRYSTGENQTAVARYTLAVDRRFRREGSDQNADFISCVAFGKSGEFAEKYLRKGMKIAVVGRIQTGSYTNRDGQKVYTTDVVVEDHEFAESKSASEGGGTAAPSAGGQFQSPMGSSPAAPGPMPSAPSSGQPWSPAPVATSYAPHDAMSAPEGFMNIPDGIDEDLPFN